MYAEGILLSTTIFIQDVQDGWSRAMDNRAVKIKGEIAKASRVCVYKRAKDIEKKINVSMCFSSTIRKYVPKQEPYLLYFL